MAAAAVRGEWPFLSCVAERSVKVVAGMRTADMYWNPKQRQTPFKSHWSGCRSIAPKGCGYVTRLV